MDDSDHGQKQVLWPMRVASVEKHYCRHLGKMGSACAKNLIPKTIRRSCNSG